MAYFFLGLDPSTDLRGCGFLGLLTTLYLVTEYRMHGLALEIYKLSQHETQNFPFAIMSINITRIALQTLREGKLNKWVQSLRMPPLPRPLRQSFENLPICLWNCLFLSHLNSSFAWWCYFTTKTRVLLVVSIVKLLFPIVSLLL